eukprot:13630106-Alexandrium_andersonii.AAC.1
MPRFAIRCGSLRDGGREGCCQQARPQFASHFIVGHRDAISDCRRVWARRSSLARPWPVPFDHVDVGASVRLRVPLVFISAA